MEFGAHVSSGGGIDTAIDRVVAMGGDCVQIFTQSPRMWRPTNHKPAAIEAFPADTRITVDAGAFMLPVLHLWSAREPRDVLVSRTGAPTSGMAVIDPPPR